MAFSLLHTGGYMNFLVRGKEMRATNSKLQRTTLQVYCGGLDESEMRDYSLPHQKEGLKSIKRRETIGLATLSAMMCSFQSPFTNSVAYSAGGLPQEEPKKLCDPTCEKELENVQMVTTESGLQFKDIKVGTGPSPPVGFQVAANYVAMLPSGKVFDSSIEKGQPYIFRVGAGQVIKGLDEGILSMKVGGRRRIYVPGPLAFPKGLGAAAGRPRVPPSSPIVFDVSLEFIPGLDDDLE